MSESSPLERLRAAGAALASLRIETDSPAVAMALRHAIYYCHLAGGFLGDERLGPEVDGDLAEPGAGR